MTAMSSTKGHHKWAAKRCSTRGQHKGAAHREALQFAFTKYQLTQVPINRTVHRQNSGTIVCTERYMCTASLVLSGDAVVVVGSDHQSGLVVHLDHLAATVGIGCAAHAVV